MAKQPNDDLFAESTMSFGEHLEELRTALGKAVVGVVIGFLIGLAIGEYIVTWVKSPLINALEGYMVEHAIDQVKRDYNERDEPIPQDLEAFVKKQKMVSEKVYVDAAEVTRMGGFMLEHAIDQVKRDYNERDEQIPQDLEAFVKTHKKKHKLVSLEADAAAQDAAAQASDSAATTVATSKFVGGKPQPPAGVFVETRIWRPIRAVAKALSAQEAFMIYLKAAFVAGMIIASPYVFWQIWNFVAAGLYPHEKKYVNIYLPFSLGLFFSGGALAFFVVFPYILRFLFAFNKTMNIDPDPRISEWLSFAIMMPLAFGIAFQLPLVMLFLNRIGLISIQVYASKWRIAVLTVFVLSAFLNPSPDPVSMCLMAAPLTALYFLGMGLCKWMPRNASPFSEAYEP
jgi:sec-independent protein translocase protein TatC